MTTNYQEILKGCNVRELSPQAAAANQAGAPVVVVVNVQPADYVTIPLAATITGLSAKAIENKIDEGVWLEGREWKRGEDGRRYVNVSGYVAWVRGGTHPPRTRAQCAKPSKNAERTPPPRKDT